MSKQVIFIQPLEQIWAKQDRLYLPADVKAIDKLNDDLSFKKTLYKMDRTDVRTLVSCAIRDGIVKAGGWIRITAYDPTPEEIWPLAMKALGAGKTEDLI